MVLIREMFAEDWEQVVKIYWQGLETGNATFETEAPSFESWDSAHLADCRFVSEIDGLVVGWAALSPVSSRCVYGGVAEVSVYVHKDYRGQKIGQLLLRSLVNSSEEKGYWTLQSGIFEENTPSVNLHHRLGFRTVGFRERIGRDKKGRWRNTLLLERRSTKVGLD